MKNSQITGASRYCCHVHVVFKNTFAAAGIKCKAVPACLRYLLYTFCFYGVFLFLCHSA